MLALWCFLPVGTASTETLRTVPRQAVQRSDVTSAVILGSPRECAEGGQWSAQVCYQLGAVAVKTG